MRINWTRVILGGIVAGIVGDILGYVVDGVILAPRWAAAMTALGKTGFSVSQNVEFNIIGLIYGIFMVWLYAAIRPRYGAGPKTAICAGLAVWAAGVLLPNAGFMWAAGLFPTSLTMMTTAAAIVEVASRGIGWCSLVSGGRVVTDRGAVDQQSALLVLAFARVVPRQQTIVWSAPCTIRPLWGSRWQKGGFRLPMGRC